tara:strand:+ start:1070 stop:2164 length:1095 start_codon:yes stop_codon:yes gene_type:complete
MQRTLILLVSFLAISAAGPAGPARAADADETFKAITKASVFDHIVPRYKKLSTAGAGLEVAATDYCQDRTAQSFATLDNAFRGYWITWAGIRHIQFGPVQFENRGFRVQFWPDFRNKTGKQLSRVLAAEDRTTLEKETFAKTSIAVQGLPAMERLLVDGHAGFVDTKGSFKCALAETIARNLATIAKGIAADWNPTDGYAHTVATAGTGDSPYAEASEVPVELLQSLLGELEASHDVRLGRPLGSEVDKARPKLAEAWRSSQSKAILVTTLKGTGDLYLSGGFDRALRDAGERALADRITAGFQKTITEADALEGSLYDAFTTPKRREKLETIRADLKILTGLIGTDLAVALDISPGFNSRDGD